MTDNINKGLDKLSNDIKGFGGGKYINNNVVARRQRIKLTKFSYTRDDVKRIIDDIALIHDIDVVVEYDQKESLY